MKLLTVFALFAITIAAGVACAEELDDVENIQVPNVINEEVAQDLFAEFIKAHAKNYRSEVEQLYRLKVFTDNLHFIAKHNKEAAKGMHSYTLGIGPFADLTVEEFSEMYLMKNSHERNSTNEDDDDIPHEDDDDIPHEDDDDIPHEDDDDIPHGAEVPVVGSDPTLDWRSKNCVGKIRNQKQCGSCWAFSAAATIEGAYAQKTGKLYDVSEQQMIDCDTVSQGCNGGWVDSALRSVISKGGIQAESTYPYCACSGGSRTCRFDATKVVAKISSYTTVASGTPNESAIFDAVTSHCSVSVYINASTKQFQHYNKGVFDYSGCPTSTDHAVALVGYGTKKGKPFWWLRNSWGTGWGKKGYMQIIRNKNMCGLAKYSYYANA